LSELELAHNYPIVASEICTGEVMDAWNSIRKTLACNSNVIGLDVSRRCAGRLSPIEQVSSRSDL